MKFKVGDKVKVKKGCTSTSIWLFMGEMRNIESFVISEINTRGDTIRTRENRWSWDSNWLELEKPRENPTYGQLLTKLEEKSC